MKIVDIFLDNDNVPCICQEADFMVLDSDTRTVTLRNLHGETKGIVNIDKVIAILKREEDEPEDDEKKEEADD